jgi:hypothetical protein
MEPKTLKYFVIVAAIVLLIGSSMFLLLLSTVILLIVADWADPLFHYYPGIFPYLVGVPGFFLLLGSLLMLRLRASPTTNRMIFFALGVVSIAIGVLYFFSSFGPLDPSPGIDPTAPGPIIMYTFPIIGGILTIMAPLLKVQE